MHSLIPGHLHTSLPRHCSELNWSIDDFKANSASASPTELTNGIEKNNKNKENKKKKREYLENRGFSMEEGISFSNELWFSVDVKI